MTLVVNELIIAFVILCGRPCKDFSPTRLLLSHLGLLTLEGLKVKCL